MKKKKADWWSRYIEYLEESPKAIGKLVEELSPKTRIQHEQRIKIKRNYKLWSFQEEILKKIKKHQRELIIGLPTGLGKTYVAGAYLEENSKNKEIRVLFIVPSVPLGVQQTLFARERLNVKEAYFISGAIPPEKRKKLNVWNAAFTVTTPQTFSNDYLYPFQEILKEARKTSDPIKYLKEILKDAEFKFPYDIIIADECQRYVGETDGYSILITAAASEKKILALSATPQLHSPQRLRELKKIFNKIEVFSIETPEIKKFIPPRLLYIVRLPTPPTLLRTYKTLNKTIYQIEREIQEKYGRNHLYSHCNQHSICKKRMMLRLLNFRMIEDGASSVLKYGTWKINELHRPLKELDGKSIIQTYRRALKECYNHKINAAEKILETEKYEKAIIFAEAVEAIKQLGRRLQEKHGIKNTAILIGKGTMSIEQQASALIQFKDEAKILVSTSVGEEGLDIPTADLEIWIDPPSNPRKWIQRFGRILRQPEKEKIARIYALISMQTHEKIKLKNTMKKSEEIYGFTQKTVYKDIRKLEKGQTTITSFIYKRK